MNSPPINPTPVHLIHRLQLPTDQEAWRRFVRLYTPLMYSWARRLGFSPEDATDRVQDTFLVLAVKLPDFTYDPNGRFRGWLWTVFLNCCRQAKRRPDLLASATQMGIDQLACDDTCNEAAEAEFNAEVVRATQNLLRTEYPELTREAFWRYVALGQPAAVVAEELGVSVDFVYQVKTRVLRRLRQAFAGLIDPTGEL